MNAPTTWKPTTRERYWEMLEILPPAEQTGAGFLVGEPWTHRQCTITWHRDQPAFAAFVERRSTFGFESDYFEATRPLTVAEFRTVRTSDIIVEA